MTDPPLELPRPVVEALDAAGIPATRVGRRRGEHLAAVERELYIWILRRFAEEGAPPREATSTEAKRLQLNVDEVCAKLADEDLVRFDAAGEATVAYPFSGRRTAHRVTFNGRSVYAMCAIDALGMAPMFDQQIEISSRDPITDVGIRVRLVGEDGTATWQPEETVVIAGRACEGPAFRGCCQVLNFFTSPASAEQYLRERDDIRGHVISLPDAVDVGRCVFGHVLRGTT
jgi:hypothetical protein